MMIISKMVVFRGIFLLAGGIWILGLGTDASNQPQPIAWSDVGKSKEVKEMREGFRIFEWKFIPNHTKGMNAMNAALSQLKNKKNIDWLQVSKNYQMAFWNLPYAGSEDLRWEIDDILGNRLALNNQGLNVAKLGFGWRREAGWQEIQWMNHRSNLLETLRNGSQIQFQDISNTLEKIKSYTGESLTDKRSVCAKMQDVAELLAEALQWDNANEALKYGCGDNISITQKGRLLGFFSEGIREVKISTKIKSTIKSLLAELQAVTSEYRKNPQWAAALVSFFQHTFARLKGSTSQIESDPDPNLDPKLHDKWASISQEEMSEEIDKAKRNNYRQLLPILKKAYELKKQKIKGEPRIANINAYDAYRFYVNNLCDYYRKDGDLWASWRWFVARNMFIDGAEQQRWMIRLSDMLAIGARQMARMLLQSKQPLNQNEIQAILKMKNVPEQEDKRLEKITKELTRDVNEETIRDSFKRLHDIVK